MPVRRVGKGCYQWGHHGKVYCGPGARAKAERQGRAAYSHGYQGREMRDYDDDWYRGGTPNPNRPTWLARNPEYAEFYGDPVLQCSVDTNVLDLTHIGIEYDGEEIEKSGVDAKVASRRPASGQMYDWAEKNAQTLQRLGIGAVVVMQEHDDFQDDRPQETVLVFDPNDVRCIEHKRERVREMRERALLPASSFILAGNKALDAISNLDEVPPGYLQGDALRDAAYRALEAGAEPPLEYIGAGATGIVFCDPSFAFKVARHRRGYTLEDEAEWLETAASIPEVAPYVAYLERWDPEQRVIVRECVRGDRGTWGGSSKIHALWDQIAPYMLAEGWTMPELKEDSVIFVDGVPKIVDAGMVSRISNRLLGYVEDVLNGHITPDEYEDWSTLAFYVRREFGQKEGLDEDRANLILERLYQLGARRD